MTTPPVLTPPAESDPESAWASVEEIQVELERLRRQRLRLDQREQQLLRALALACRGRVRELLDAGGVPAPVLEAMVSRAVGSSRRSADDVPEDARVPEVDKVRKAPLRFRHPDNPGLVWSGRGKSPRWVLNLQAQGRLEEARVRQAEG